MHISHKLLQFDDERALLIVAGFKDADFYRAHNGIVRKIDSVAIPHPWHSDREGFFMSRGRGGTFRSGSTYEPKKEKVLADFLKLVQDRTDVIVRLHQITKAYLFSPPHIQHSLVRAFPERVRRMIAQTFSGNFQHDHPFKLISRIKRVIDERLESVKRPSPEARRLLDISEQARSVIKNKKQG